MPTNEPTTKEWRPAFFTTGEDCCIWLVDPKSRCGYSLSSFRCIVDRKGFYSVTPQYSLSHRSREWAHKGQFPPHFPVYKRGCDACMPAAEPYILGKTLSGIWKLGVCSGMYSLRSRSDSQNLTLKIEPNKVQLRACAKYTLRNQLDRQLPPPCCLYDVWFITDTMFIISSFSLYTQYTIVQRLLCVIWGSSHCYDSLLWLPILSYLISDPGIGTSNLPNSKDLSKRKGW